MKKTIRTPQRPRRRLPVHSIALTLAGLLLGAASFAAQPAGTGIGQVIKPPVAVSKPGGKASIASTGAISRPAATSSGTPKAAGTGSR